MRHRWWIVLILIYGITSVQAASIFYPPSGGGGGGPPSGAAGGALTGTYPSPALAQTNAQLPIKAPVRVASTAPVTLATPGDTHDGVVLAINDRLLLTAQTDPTENGLYLYTNAVTALTRTTDADLAAELVPGSLVLVQEGTTNGPAVWMFINLSVPVLGTDDLLWRQVQPADRILVPIADLPADRPPGAVRIVLDAAHADTCAASGGDTHVACEHQGEGLWTPISQGSTQRAHDSDGPYGAGFTNVPAARPWRFYPERQTLGEEAPREERWGDSGSIIRRCVYGPVASPLPFMCDDIFIPLSVPWRLSHDDGLGGETTDWQCTNSAGTLTCTGWLKSLKEIHESCTTQGGVLYRGASALACLSPGTAGQVLRTEGAASNPTWGYPAGLTIASQAQGDILYYNGSAWVRLAPGTAGQRLQTNGAGANPSWVSRTGQACLEVVNPDGTDNVQIPWIAPSALTVTSVSCKVVSGTVSVAPTFTLTDDDGNAMTHASPTCAAIGTDATAQAVTAGGSLVAGEGMQYDVGNSPDANDTFVLCWTFDL